MTLAFILMGIVLWLNMGAWSLRLNLRVSPKDRDMFSFPGLIFLNSLFWWLVIVPFLLQQSRDRDKLKMTQANTDLRAIYKPKPDPAQVQFQCELVKLNKIRGQRKSEGLYSSELARWHN